jgi:hypothetical protein
VEAPFEGVIAASWEGRYRSPPRPKSLREIMKEKESNERDHCPCRKPNSAGK